MYRALFLFAALIVPHATAVRAQSATPPAGGVTLADVAGVWDYKATVTRSKAVVDFVLTATADGKGWTIQHDKDRPVPIRIDTVAGDSIDTATGVTAGGPYASPFDRGQTVERLDILLHYHDGKMSGNFLSLYKSGDIFVGTFEAIRRQ